MFMWLDLLRNARSSRALVILFIVGLSCVMAMAQEASPVEVVADGGEEVPERESRGRFMWGPTVGVDIFAMENSFGPMRRHNSMGFGVAAGAMMRYLYDNRWFIDAGLNFAYDYAPVKVAVFNQESDNPDFEEYDADRCALQLPVYLGYRLKLVDRFYFNPFTGVMLSYGLAGRMDAPKGMPEYNLYGQSGVWRRFSASWAIGWNFDIGDSVGVGFAAFFGANRMARRKIFETSTMNEVSCRVYFTYWFGVK